VNVDDAEEVLRSEPPVMVRPFDERRPAVAIPPAKVDDAALVLRSEPPVMVKPFDEERPADESPPVIVVDVPSPVTDNLSRLKAVWKTRLDPFEIATVEDAPGVVVMAQLPFTARHPAARLIPPLKVEVAEEVLKSEPPVMVKPFDEERPADAMPPVKVEEADEVLRIVPAVIVRPLVVRSPDAVIPPCAVVVAVDEPKETSPLRVERVPIELVAMM